VQKGDQPMNKISKKSVVTMKPSNTVGLDVGDRYSYYRVLSANAELTEEGRIRTTKGSLASSFRRLPAAARITYLLPRTWRGLRDRQA
jgi:hypothetical protein